MLIGGIAQGNFAEGNDQESRFRRHKNTSWMNLSKVFGIRVISLICVICRKISVPDEF
jgi:hypothetical protein